MENEKSTCLFVGKNADLIEGVITDISLKDNMLAKRRSPDCGTVDIVDTRLVSISLQLLICEALLLMFRTKTRYLLVEDFDCA